MDQIGALVETLPVTAVLYLVFTHGPFAVLRAVYLYTGKFPVTTRL